MENNSLANKRLARNSIFMTIRMVIVLCLTFYTTRVVLSVLGVEDYGVYNVVCGFVSMFGFLNTSISNGIQRFYNFEIGKNGVEGAKQVYNTSLVVQIILAIIIIILTESFGLWYLYNKMVIPADRMIAAQWIFQFSILSFLFVILQAPFSASVMAHEKMDFYALVNVIDAVLKLLIVLAIPYFNSDYLIVYGALLALISLLNLLVYYVYAKHNFDEIRMQRKFNRNLFKSILGFSGWNVFGSISGVMKDQGINLVMNFFFGPIVNAARGVAVQVNGGLQSFVRNITIPVRPQVIQSYAQGNISRTVNLTYSISKLTCFFIIMTAVPLVLNIDFILNVWLGKNVPEHTNTFVVIIFALSMVSNLNAAISGIVHATGKMKKYQIVTSLFEILSIPFAYFVLRLYPIPELALIIVLIGAILSQTASVFIVKELIPLSVIQYTKEVVCPILVVGCTTILSTWLIHCILSTGLVGFVVDTLFSISISMLIILLFCLNQSERELIRSVYKKIRKK